MPIIPPGLLNCVFYLYRNLDDARAGAGAGGTGFFLAMPTEDGLGHHYGVTNWHVAVQGGYSCIRINTTLGGVEIFELGPEDWHFEAGKDDIAIVPLDIRQPTHVAMFIGSQLLLSPQSAAEVEIGPGDDVFMIGRFVDIDSTQTNVPALRFGNISTPPVPIEQPTGYKTGSSYCIDMHSRSGYSGSPVFVYRTPGGSLEWAVRGGPVALGGSLLALLGIHWGQFPEQLAIKRKVTKQRRESLGSKAHEEYIEGMSGMTCVIPSWRIADLLMGKFLAELREKERAARRKK